MPNVIINEKDYTITNVTENLSNNIVYVPGIASTGPSTPTLIRDYNTFVETFGTSPDDSSLYANSWDYATGLLLEGFPILFHRIADVGETKANVVITTGTDPDPVVSQLKIESKFAGTDGNKFTVTLDDGNWTSGTPVTIKAIVTLVSSSVVLETINICDVGADATTWADVFALMKTAIDESNANDGVGFTSEYVTFEVMTPSGSTFELPTGWATSYTLANGTNGTTSAVVTKLNTATFSDSPFYSVIDKDLYSVKFVTAGGLCGSSGSDEMYLNMKLLAETRGECLAVLDAPKDGFNDSTKKVEDFFTGFVSSYTTWYYPWARFTLPTGKIKWVAPSFEFLFELAKSVGIGNPIWLPPAGVNRGSVPEAVELSKVIGGTTADIWYNNKPALNPIRPVRNYGYTIYGQRTMYYVDSGKKSAFQDLNVRLAANEIKKYIDEVAVSLTFEGNNYSTWMAFYTKMDSYLMSMKSSGGLEAYDIIMDNSTTSDEDIANNIIRGIVRVQITRAAEDFMINFQVVNNLADFVESVPE